MMSCFCTVTSAAAAAAAAALLSAVRQTQEVTGRRRDAVYVAASSI